MAQENLSEVASRALQVGRPKTSASTPEAVTGIGKGTFTKKDIKRKNFGDWVNFKSRGKDLKGIVVSKKGSTFVVQTFGKSGIERVYHVELR